MMESKEMKENKEFKEDNKEIKENKEFKEDNKAKKCS